MQPPEINRFEDFVEIKSEKPMNFTDFINDKFNKFWENITTCVGETAYKIIYQMINLRINV